MNALLQMDKDVVNENQLVFETKFKLNKSGTKSIHTGFSPEAGLSSVVKITSKHWGLYFYDNEWENFMLAIKKTLKYFENHELVKEQIVDDIHIECKEWESTPLVHIWRRQMHINLGYESIKGLLKAEDALTYKIKLLNNIGFIPYYTRLLSSLSDDEGDVLEKIKKVLNFKENVNFITIHCMLELLQLAPQRVVKDFEIVKDK